MHSRSLLRSQSASALRKSSKGSWIQELINNGLRQVKAVKPEHDKKMRLNAQTATIENGFVYLPREASWLHDYLHELTTFPNAKHDDQADSTSQALEWINLTPAEPPSLTFMRFELARRGVENGQPIEEASSLRLMSKS